MLLVPIILIWRWDIIEFFLVTVANMSFFIIYDSLFVYINEIDRTADNWKSLLPALFYIFLYCFCILIIKNLSNFIRDNRR